MAMWSCRRMVILMVMLLGAALVQAQEAPAQNERTALEIVAQINMWRMEQGLSPLRPNATLQAMALDQAQYLASLSTLPRASELHVGRNGETPPQRAILEPYNWPVYGRPDRVSIGENAAIGSVRSAMAFWRGSEIHRGAALNPGYREIGVAAIPFGSDTLFIVVFGARPNVLPAFYNPQDGQLYLSSERYRYAAGGTWVQAPTQVRLFATDGQPISDWMPWQAMMPLPKGTGSIVFILYTDGQQQALAEVVLKDNVTILPGILPGGLPPTATPAAPSAPILPTVQATFTPTATMGPLVTRTPSPTPQQTGPTATPQPAGPTPTVTLAPVTTDLELIYNATSLTVLNASGRALDLTTLAFQGSQVGFAARGWTQVVDVPLAAFPNGHCLQLQLSGSAPVSPQQCRFVRSIVQLGAGRTFWTQGSFDVLLNGVPVATCPANMTRCVITVPR